MIRRTLQISVFLLALPSCDAAQDDDRGDISPYLGEWDGSIAFPGIGGGWPLSLTVKDDGTAAGRIDMQIGSTPCDSDLDGEVWADQEPWHFYAELQESGCTSSLLYLGGALEDGQLGGVCGEGSPPDEAETDCIFLLD